MTSIDKVAIAFSIAIVAVGVGFAFYMGGVQDAGPVASAPMVTKSMEPKPQAQPSAPVAEEVKEPVVQEKVIEEKTTKTEEKSVELEEEIKVEEKATSPSESSGPKKVTVDIPTGTSSPGCEESDKCYIPASVTINTGDTVEWKNIDTAAHTVTGGSPADGPSGVFDSSLLMGGASFAHTFDEAGSYDYFCMVHPWMVGSVQVN